MTLKLDARNRSPLVDRLSDDRNRVTREYDILPTNPKMITAAQMAADVWLPWGTADDIFTDCRLVAQRTSGQLGNPYDDPNKEPPRLVRVFEELPAVAELEVGEMDLATDQSNILTATKHLLQFSSGPDIFGRIGVDTVVAGTTTVVLKSDRRTNDGTLKTITREYISAGEISHSEDIRHNGKLIIKTVTAVNQIPTVFDAGTSTFAIISKKTEHPSGVPVYTYGFASGYGQISEAIEYRNSVDQGVTGLTIYTVKFLTPASVQTNPIDPLSAGTSFILVNTSYEEQEGYRVWTAVFGRGKGTIVSENDVREGGKLVVYKRIALGIPPATPAATIGGAVTATKVESRLDRYHEATTLYDYEWAEGFGEISREFSIDLNGTTPLNTTTLENWGVVTCTIRHLTATSVTTNPTSPPDAPYILTSLDRRDADGYRLWTAQYRSGETEDAFIEDVETKNNGKLVIYRRSSLAFAPSAPSPTIGGTVVPIDQKVSNESGFQRYDYTWAEGRGIVSDEFEARNDGLGLWRRTIFSSDNNVVPFAPLAGAVLIRHEARQEDGFVVNDTAWMLMTTGTTALPAGTTILSYGIKHPFEYPGRAKAYSVVFPAKLNGAWVNAINFDVFKSPPVRVELDATVEIGYQTSQALGALPYTFWNPTDWASVRAYWQDSFDGVRNQIISLPGYLNAGTSITFYAGTSFAGGVQGWGTSILGHSVVAGSQGQIAVSGGPSSPEGQTLVIAEPELTPAFYDILNKRQWYRKTVIYASIPTQAALPI